jgi:Nif-specific regulatory protein
VVWLAGDAGSGKSRILRWLVSEGAGAGWDVISGLPALTWRATAHGELATVQRFVDELARTAESKPALLLLDEAETAPPLAVELLDRVARGRDCSSFKIVAALRPSEIDHPDLRRLLADEDLLVATERIDLDPLAADAVAEVAQRATGTATVSPQRARWLVEASEGNPLLLETLLVDESWEKGGRSATHRTLEESVAARVEALSPSARAWLEALVVLGRDAPARLVSGLSGLAEEEGLSAAEELLPAGLARIDGDRWSPASRIVADCVRSDVKPDQLRHLHRRAAELIESEEGAEANPGRLANLWAAAGERQRVRGLAEEAAKRADKAGRPSEAADWLRLAVGQLDRRDPDRADLRQRQADLLIASGRHREAYRALATSLRLARDAGGRARILARQARTLVSLSQFRRVLDRAGEARRLAASADLPDVAAEAAIAAGMAMLQLALYEEGFAFLTEAAAEHAQLGDGRGQAECLQLAGLCSSKLRSPDAWEHLDQALDLSRESEDVRLEANVLISMALAESRAWRLLDSLRLLERARERIAARDDLRQQQLVLLNNMANVLELSGRMDRALQVARETATIAANLGSRNWLLSSALNEGNALTLAGRPAEAAALLSRALEDARSRELAQLGYVKLTLAEALMHCPEPDHVRIDGLLREILGDETAEPKLHLAALLLEMERQVSLGSEKPFEPIRTQYDELLGRHPDALEPPYRARADLALARHLLDEKEREAAEKSARETAAYAEAKGLSDLAARAWGLIAEAQRGTGRQADADRSLERGRRLLDEAAARIEDESMRRDFLDRRVYRSLRAPVPAGPSAGEERLLAIYDMIRALNSEADPDLLLESMLDMALRVVRAERGMVLLREEGSDDYRVRVARNLEQETIEDASEFSRNVVLKAGAGEAVLAVDTGQDERLRELKSVSMYGIRSVLCVPLRSRGRIVGAVYLDNRSDASLFTAEDLRFLEAFADHAALALENAQARRELELENQRLQQAAETRVRFGNIVGRSPAMQRVYELIRGVADNKAPVLVLGESGTGKELVARAIHFNGPRRRKPFVSENCAAIPETLLESELFGHVKGAFTGAERDRTGLFEQAEGGTLLLDEVGDMSAAMQARLLRVLQEGELRRVGGERWIAIDVRVIAATHRDLAAEVEAGRFREDLFYRLQVLVIPLPPLRERGEDIPLLVEHFLKRIAKERGRPAPKLRSEVMELLERYRWPGNIRQLENTLQRLVLLAGEGPITTSVLESDAELRKALLGDAADTAPVFSLEHTEEQKIREALRAAEGNRTKAAKLLGISRATIFRKIKQYDLS